MTPELGALDAASGRAFVSGSAIEYDVLYDAPCSPMRASAL
jgi:hypothetical protein